MGEHDPLCVNRLPGWCYCDLIARVRADERERIAQDVAQLLIDACCLALDDEGKWTVADNLDPISLIEVMPRTELDAALALLGGESE